MDVLDLRILATMGYTPWGHRPQDPDQLRPSTLAKRLDVTPETIRDRIDKMEQAGVIQAWEAYPNPCHADLTAGGWAFRPPDEPTADDAVAEAGLVDGVLEIITYHGPFVVVALAYRDSAERDRRLTLIGHRFQDDDPVHVFDPPMPDVDRELDGLDWRIVQALRGQARRPLRDVADEVGASYRTVKRRFDRMTGEGSLFVVPRVDLSRVSGILPFTLVNVLADAADEDTVNALARRFSERILHELLPTEPSGALAVLGLWADTTGEMDDLVQAAAGMDGVERAFALLSKGRTTTDWLDARIAHRADA